MNPFSLKKEKNAGGMSQQLLPYLLIGSLGAGGGTLGHSLVSAQGLTPDQHRTQIERVLDKLENIERHMDERLDKVERELERLKERTREQGRIKSDW